VNNIVGVQLSVLMRGQERMNNMNLAKLIAIYTGIGIFSIAVAYALATVIDLAQGILTK
jgi:hypothetical protein